MLPPEVFPWDASYRLVCTRRSSSESGDGMGKFPRLLLPRLFASVPLITRLLLVPRCPSTNMIAWPRPASVAFGSGADVPALSASRKVKFRVESGKLWSTSPVSTLPRTALVVFTVWATSAETVTSVLTWPSSNETLRLVISVTPTDTLASRTLLKLACSTATLYAPGVTNGNTTVPSSAVCLMVGAPKSEESVTLAPTMAPPFWSVTTTCTAPVCAVICADAVCAPNSPRHKHSSDTQIRNRLAWNVISAPSFEKFFIRKFSRGSRWSTGEKSTRPPQRPHGLRHSLATGSPASAEVENRHTPNDNSFAFNQL